MGSRPEASAAPRPLPPAPSHPARPPVICMPGGHLHVAHALVCASLLLQCHSRHHQPLHHGGSIYYSRHVWHALTCLQSSAEREQDCCSPTPESIHHSRPTKHMPSCAATLVHPTFVGSGGVPLTRGGGGGRPCQPVGGDRRGATEAGGEAGICIASWARMLEIGRSTRAS